MTTQTLTLAEFLLARIDDDEREAQYLGSVGLNGPQYGSVNGAFNGLISRVLAECEAKRRLIREAEDQVSEYFSRFILTTLALPYADHPDFRGEWRQ